MASNGIELHFLYWFVSFIRLQEASNIDKSDASDDDDEPTQVNDLTLLLLEDQDNIAAESQMKTITLKEYTDIVQLIPQMIKCKDTIKRMEKIIKSKDAQLKQLKSTLDQGKCINVSHLSSVSKR